MGADGDIHGVILLLQILNENVLSDGGIADGLEARLLEALNLVIQYLSRQTVGRDAVAQHAAQLLTLLIHRHIVAHDTEIVGRTEAGGTAADHGDLLAGGLHACRRRHLALMLHGKALQTPDIHGIVHHGSAAAHLTGMLADETADRRQGIILPDELHRIMISALMHQGNVARNVHVGRTLEHTGHRLVLLRPAAAVLNVLHIIVPEALHALQHHPGCLRADGTVCGIINAGRRLLDGLQCAHVRTAVHHPLNEPLQLGQTHPAGHTFAAGLGMAEMQKGLRQIHGAESRLGSLNPPLQILVKLFHSLLGIVLRVNT